MDGLELGTPVWRCLPCPCQYPGGRHTLGTMKAVPTGPQSRQMGSAGCWMGVNWGSGAWVGRSEGQLDLEHPLSSWHPGYHGNQLLFGRVWLFAASPHPPTHMWRWEGGQVACGGGASHTLPLGPPSLQRNLSGL